MPGELIENLLAEHGLWRNKKCIVSSVAHKKEATIPEYDFLKFCGELVTTTYYRSLLPG